MPSEIIRKLTDAENSIEERERLARAESKEIVAEAHAKAKEIISEAEEFGEELIKKAEKEARTCAEKLRTERESALNETLKQLNESAQSNSSRISDEIIKIITA